MSEPDNSLRAIFMEALAIEDQAFEEFSQQGDRRLAGAARVYLSYILLDLGELQRAHDELVIALEGAQLL